MKPLLTLVLLAANIWVHLFDVVLFGFFLGDTQRICFRPSALVERGHYHRVLLAPFVHLDDGHLYYNMVSLLWKGIQLEGRLGLPAFAVLVVWSVLGCALAHVGLAVVLLQSGYPSSYHTCSAGFSGVLFSLKYVLNYGAPENSVIMGFSVPTKYAAWAELVVISLITPNVSFLGHLAGIAAGMAYVHGLPLLLRAGVVPPEAAGVGAGGGGWGFQPADGRAHIRDGVIYRDQGGW